MTEYEYERLDPLWKSGNFLFQSGVTDETCAQAMRFLTWHNMQDSPLKKLTLVINSPGGSVTAAFALIDTMKTSNIPVHTLALGQIASCGVLLFMSGVDRVISENCTALSHQYSWGSNGKHADLVSVRKAQDMTHELLVKHYMKCTKKTRAYVERELLPHQDVWLTAEETLAHGIADSIKTIY